MHSSNQNIKTVEEMLSDAIFGFNSEEVISLVKQVNQENNSVDAKKQILNKALEGANQTEVGRKINYLKGSSQKLKYFLKKSSSMLLHYQ